MTLTPRPTKCDKCGGRFLYLEEQRICGVLRDVEWTCISCGWTPVNQSKPLPFLRDRAVARFNGAIPSTVQTAHAAAQLSAAGVAIAAIADTLCIGTARVRMLLEDHDTWQQCDSCPHCRETAQLQREVAG